MAKNKKATAMRGNPAPRLPEELQEQLDRAVWWTRATKNAVMAEAIRREVRRLQRRHNGGEPFSEVPR